MRNQKEPQAILGKVVKRAVSAPERRAPDVVSHRLAFTDEEPAGYNPYDKPPPPITEEQLEASMDRRSRTKSER